MGLREPNSTSFKKGHVMLPEVREKISKTLKGKNIWSRGIKLNEEHKKKIGRSKEKHWNWQGGITKERDWLRLSSKWRIWRELVYLRDNFICQNEDCEFCNNQRGVMLHPHHIKPKKLYPELMFRPDNGITYCAEHHLKGNLHNQISVKEVE